jgi:hypothetical protein
MARRGAAADELSDGEPNPYQKEIVMTDDTKREPTARGGRSNRPAEDPFHNVILFPNRRKEPSNEGPPPPSAA